MKICFENMYIPRNSFTAWPPIPPAAPVTKAWSPSRPRKDMIRVSCKNFLGLCLELCREMNWAIEIERYRNTDCMTLNKVTYKQLLLSDLAAACP